MINNGYKINCEKKALCNGLYNVGIVGATGNTGKKVLEILSERNFPINNIVAIASDKSEGKEEAFGDKIIRIQRFNSVDFSQIHIAFFCAGGAFSRENAEIVAECGCIVIDKTSHFRLNPAVPLIVPEINMSVLHRGVPLGIVSTPNCIATPLALTLKALSQISPLKRVVVSTYQSVSGAGRKAVAALIDQTKISLTSSMELSGLSYYPFQKQIVYNVIPLIGEITQSGFSDEEEKIAMETRKILESEVRIAVTSARVPSLVGHCAAVACEFENSVSENNVYDAFEDFDGIVNYDLATPIDVQGKNYVFVSRIRKDSSVENGIMYWIACDNLRKGAALNSIQIAEKMISADETLAIFKRKLHQ